MVTAHQIVGAITDHLNNRYTNCPYSEMGNFKIIKSGNSQILITTGEVTNRSTIATFSLSNTKINMMATGFLFDNNHTITNVNYEDPNLISLVDDFLLKVIQSALPDDNVVKWWD